MAGPPRFFVVFHRPGPAWRSGVAFREQPGVELHVAHMRAMHERGVLAIGGPFLDDTGGMAVLSTSTIDEARELAGADPALAAGLLTIEVRPWMTPMGALLP